MLYIVCCVYFYRNCDGKVDWEELCSYMLLENQQKTSMIKEYTDPPFPHPPRPLPRSPHHDDIISITYLPHQLQSSISMDDVIGNPKLFSGQTNRQTDKQTDTHRKTSLPA